MSYNPTNAEKAAFDAKEKVLFKRAVSLGLAIDSSQIDKELSPTLAHLKKQMKGISDSIDKEHPLFSKSKLGHTMTALSGMVKGLRGNQEGLESAHKSLDKLGLGWAVNTTKMIQWAVTAKKNKEIGKELTDSMGLFGKGIVKAAEMLSNTKKFSFGDLGANKIKKEDMIAVQEEELKKLEANAHKYSEKRLKDLVAQKKAEIELLKQHKETPEKTEAKLPVSEDTDKKLEQVLDGIYAVDAASKGLGKTMEITGKNSGNAIKGIAGATGEAGGAVVGLEGAVGSMGKGVTGAFSGMSKSAVAFGATLTAVTAGALLVVAGLVAMGTAMKKVFDIAILARSEMVKFDQVFNGIGEDSIIQFRKQLNGISDDLGHLGVTTEMVDGIVLNFLKSNISLARSTSSILVGTTQELATVSGQSTEAIGGFFANLIKKINVSDKSLRDLSTSFVNYNNAAKIVKGVAISFEQFKESIDSSTNALMIAKSKGEAYFKSMSQDLTSLAGLASTIGLNISDVNAKFEEAGNLINNMSSGFRSLLVISGGTNLNQMLDNTFDKTEAMLKMSSYIQGLNTQFGGNLNVTAQVVSQFGGISKEMALQLARLSSEERKRMQDLINFRASMQDDSLTESYKKVTNDFTAAWDKVKAAFINIFQKAITNSKSLGNLINKMSQFASYLQEALTGSGAKDFMDGMTAFIDKIADFISPVIDKIQQFVISLTKPNTSWIDSLWGVVKEAGKAIVNILLESAMEFGSLVIKGMLYSADKAGSIFGRSARQIVSPKYDESTIEGRALINKAVEEEKKERGITGPMDNAEYMKLRQEVREALIQRDIKELTAKAEATSSSKTYQKINQIDAQEKQQKQKEVETLRNMVSSLEKNISWNKDIIKSYNEAGLVDTDIAYGRKFNKDTGEWSDEEGFMSVGEKKEQLQKEIEYREQKKLQLMESQNATMVKVQEAAEMTNKLLLKVTINGKQIKIEDEPLPPANRPAMISEDVWKRMRGTSR